MCQIISPSCIEMEDNSSMVLQVAAEQLLSHVRFCLAQAAGVYTPGTYVLRDTSGCIMQPDAKNNILL